MLACVTRAAALSGNVASTVVADAGRAVAASRAVARRSRVAFARTEDGSSGAVIGFGDANWAGVVAEAAPFHVNTQVVPSKI